ncbi:MAG: hypothetical protein AAGG68_12115 [Bacteroidota bacterium]
MFIIKQISKEIREETAPKDEKKMSVKEAAQLLLADYENDEELTAFTVLDEEDFYETN